MTAIGHRVYTGAFWLFYIYFDYAKRYHAEDITLRYCSLLQYCHNETAVVYEKQESTFHIPSSMFI